MVHCRWENAGGTADVLSCSYFDSSSAVPFGSGECFTKGGSHLIGYAIRRDVALMRCRRDVEGLTQVELNHPIEGTRSTDAFRDQPNMGRNPLKEFAIPCAGLLIPQRMSNVHVGISTDNPVQDLVLGTNGADWAEVSNFTCRVPACLL